MPLWERPVVSAGQPAPSAMTSLVAYRFYEEGLRNYGVGDFHGAVRLFDAALAEDSLFAMAAHYAWASRSSLHQTIPAAVYDDLLRLADGATDRERLLMRATWGVALSRTEHLAIAETLATRYPTDPTVPAYSAVTF